VLVVHVARTRTRRQRDALELTVRRAVEGTLRRPKKGGAATASSEHTQTLYFTAEKSEQLDEWVEALSPTRVEQLLKAKGTFTVLRNNMNCKLRVKARTVSRHVRELVANPRLCSVDCSIRRRRRLHNGGDIRRK
jgi:hypothetical protein